MRIRRADGLSVCLRIGAATGALWAACAAPLTAGALPAPAAGPATDVTPHAFTATWSAVAGASEYRLDVYRYVGVPPTRVSEGFDACPALPPEGWTLANSGGVYTGSGSYGAAAPAVKLEADGHAVVTPAFPAPVTNLAFWCKGFGVSNSFLSVEASDGASWTTLEVVPATNAALAKVYPLAFSSGYSRFRLTYDKGVGNLAVDDVTVAYGDAAKTYVLSNAAVGAVTSHAVSAPNPGVYFYVVRASDGTAPSDDSNEVRVDTEALPQPPRIGPLAPQSVRVGASLNLPLQIEATDGDPVTATNAVASEGVSGTWGLAAGVFSYAPAAADVGEKYFAFTASDKDGACDAVAVTVTVRRAQLAAVRLAAPSGNYEQAFDALSTNGSENVWDDAAFPLEAWYACTSAVPAATYRAGNGSVANRGLYAFGAAGCADRSLGSLAAAGSACLFGVAFTNASEAAITNLGVSFTAEQWRVGASAQTNRLVVDYCVTNAVIPLHQGVWRRLGALCFASPLVTNGVQTSGACYAAQARAAAISRPVAPGDVVLVRWSDLDDAGNDHAFGIDDLRVTWSAGGPLPLAAAVGAAGLRETFDETGPDAAGELPHAWRAETRDDAARVTGSYAAAATRVTHAGGDAGIAAPGSCAFSAGGTDDVAIGGLVSTGAAKSVSLLVRLSNASGRPVRRWAVRYAVEKYRNGLCGCAVRLLASADGAAWSEVGPATLFAADSDTAASPAVSVAEERPVTFPAPVPCGGEFYLAWQIAAAEGGAAAEGQALGVDEIEILPVFGDTCVLTLR